MIRSPKNKKGHPQDGPFLSYEMLMKKIIFYGLLLLTATTSFAQWTTSPNPTVADQAATIYFDKAGTPLSATNAIYAYIGVTVNGTPWQNIIGGGSWTSPALPQLTLVSGTVYKLDITPSLYAYFGVSQSSAISQICVVFRNQAGSVQTSPDIYIPVGAFQATLTEPAENSTTFVPLGGSLTVTASNTNGNADYTLRANGETINTFTGSTYSYTDTGIAAHRSYELLITQGSTTLSRRFAVVVDPGTVTQALPAGVEDGINYSDVDATKATLVLTAPGKDFVYVAGSFNDWQPGSAHAMKKDPDSDRFWIELENLIPGTDYTYQYWVADHTPAANSPKLVKTADPYSTLVLSPFDDPSIPPANYPNLPPYPAGQEREVTVLRTGQPAYDWQVTDFQKPEKEKLIVYELLVRDFDADRSFQDVIDRIGYFQSLGVNAIELMPVMEFEGNESWGYNTAFHLALDKAYGTADKLKELIDLCHQHGIAVILDVALNHAYGRNPMARMWMDDPDGDGWGGPASDNPYFNQVATHTYSVGNDFNHSLPLTKYYTKRVIRHWIEEFRIDGFRWDLTKGFTQNCTNDENCTNAYQQDRVDVLKEYADYSWNLDPTHYVIFEHLGSDNEEKEWANYRLGETPSKGIIMWGNVNHAFGQLAMGFSSEADISRIGHMAHGGFLGKRVMGYAESHDEERLMYKNKTFGNSTNGAHNVKNLNVALSRMGAIGAFSLLVPGPKMIWHFGELGYDASIFTCENGSVNTPSDAIQGDCKLATKPQPQWSANWVTVLERANVFMAWSHFIGLKKQEAVFSGNYTLNSGNNYTQRLHIYDNTLPATQLKDVVLLGNFNVTSQAVTANFPYAGTWYNLMDNSAVNVVNPAMTITVPAGQFRLYGNQPVTLSNGAVPQNVQAVLYPNPASSAFTLNVDADTVEVYSMTGQRVRRFTSTVAGQPFAIHDLTGGVYLVKVDTASGHQVLRLVKP